MSEQLVVSKYKNKQEWIDKGTNLGTLERHIQFYIGDWIIDGEGEGYIKRGIYDEAAQITGKDVNKLYQYVSICRSIKTLRRRKELDFTHHYEVSKLPPEDQEYFLNEALKNKWSVSKLREAIKQKEIDVTNAEREAEKDAKKPLLYHENCTEFLDRFDSKSVDLLITDPPYSTDIDDLPSFIDTWLLDSIDKIKDTGRAFICIGAYPNELYTYLGYLLQTDWIVDNPLIWTYRNTLGQTPKMKYNLNYQVILHLYKETSAQLDNRITNEMFSVQDINAPDGRIGDRYHAWQKPISLADRLISHTTKPGDIIIDPFACTGTFILSASEKNRIAYGCDIDESAIKIAVNRGCKLVKNENRIRRIS